MPPVKKLLLTRHAQARLQERGLKMDWVERAVRNPLWVEPEPRDKTAERRFATIEEFGGRVLRVVCVEKKTSFVL